MHVLRRCDSVAASALAHALGLEWMHEHVRHRVCECSPRWCAHDVLRATGCCDCMARGVNVNVVVRLVLRTPGMQSWVLVGGGCGHCRSRGDGALMVGLCLESRCCRVGEKWGVY
eukprot:1092676-Prymnesium_polylepis.2